MITDEKITGKKKLSISSDKKSPSSQKKKTSVSSNADLTSNFAITNPSDKFANLKRKLQYSERQNKQY